MSRWILCIACLLSALPVACSSLKSAREASAPQSGRKAAAPWTTTFMEGAVLAAQTIEVSGPTGLLGHLVITHDADNHAHTESATAQGLRIEETQREDTDGAPIRAQLDNLVLSADVRLVVVESPAATQVVVQATGDVYFHLMKSGEERRAATMRLVGAP